MEDIKESGQITVKQNEKSIFILSIIGEIEGHEESESNIKTTKYEHIIPKLCMLEKDVSVDGILILLNTVGGDVEAGLAIAEVIASLSKPTVAVVLGGSHSIAVPIAVSANYSFIVPSATMVVHPVRVNGMIIGVSQSFDYFQQIQNRITDFICKHSKIKQGRLRKLMLQTGFLTKDLGSVLVGEEAVNEGIIQEVGGIKDAYEKLFSFIEKEE